MKEKARIGAMRLACVIALTAWGIGAGLRRMKAADNDYDRRQETDPHRQR